MDKTDKLVDTVIEAVDERRDKKTKGYDTTATVTRVEGGTVYVHIPGGVDETPASKTISAKKGDTVQVRVGGGRAWLVGNASNPPTDDAKANEALTQADVAWSYADEAKGAADEAWQYADTAKDAADSAQASANAAQTSANEAQASASNANEYATRALNGLSAVESVSETLTWITQHGTMTLTSDTELDPTHVYFVLDPNGDYVVGSTHYSLVIDPNVDDISTYYELTIDESLNNYVGTHLALDSEGLWLLPATTGTNKVLIATGAGSTYTTAGTYIINSTGGIEASFRTNGATIGDVLGNYIAVGLDGIQAYNDKGANVLDISLSGAQLTYTKYERLNYEYVITTGGGTDTKTITELSDLSIGDTFTLTFSMGPEYSFVYGTSKSYSLLSAVFQYTAPNTVSVTLPTANNMYLTRLGIVNTDYVPAWTFGERTAETTKGGYSIALGKDVEASGNYTLASGQGTKAGSAYQTAIGKYNNNNSNNVFEIGYGTSSTHKNIFEVNYAGDVNIPSGSKYKINGTALTASDVGAVPTSRTVNSKALSSDIALTASDVGALPNPSAGSVSEMGQYIDLHASGGATDYDVRLATNQATSTGGGFLHINGQPMKDFVIDNTTVTTTGLATSWTVRKWNSGYCEAFAVTESTGYPMTSQYTNGWYYAATQTLSGLPFTSVTYGQVDRCGGSSTGGLITASLYNLSTSQIQWYAFDTRSETVNCSFAIRIVGKWK